MFAMGSKRSLSADRIEACHRDGYLYLPVICASIARRISAMVSW